MNKSLSLLLALCGSTLLAQSSGQIGLALPLATAEPPSFAVGVAGGVGVLGGIAADAIIAGATGGGSLVIGGTGTGFVPQGAPTDHDTYVKCDPTGRYFHDIDVRVTFVQASVDGLVLQCVRPSNAVYAVYRTDGKSMCVPDFVWREVYVIRDGKLALDRIQLPKVTPATDEQVEWGTRDVVIGGK